MAVLYVATREDYEFGITTKDTLLSAPSLSKAIGEIRDDIKKIEARGFLTELKPCLRWGNEVYAKQLMVALPGVCREYSLLATYIVEQVFVDEEKTNV